jgi:cyclic pyranopterin phosphate synthase
MLIDPFGRVIDYLRVSITDRCNLRCVYCMPPEGVEWKPHNTMLSFEEILRLCGLMAGLGIHKIKVTGGEPLVRRGTAAFIKNLKTLPGIENVTLTTNGLLLGAYLDETETLGNSAGALPDGINISLDALNPRRYGQISRYEGTGPAVVLPFIDRLLEKGITVKLNCVPIRSLNEDEILPLSALAKEKDITVRFIELMPIGSAGTLKPVPGEDIAALLEKNYGTLAPFSGVRGNGPAVYYSLPGFSGKIGFINAISRGFCGACNRLRLSSEGLLKPCLANEFCMDLRKTLRSGASDSDLIQAVNEAVSKKPRFHSLSKVYGASSEERPAAGMYCIGG